MIDYSCHTAYTDPGAYAGLLEALPAEVGAVSAAVRNVVVHYMHGGVALEADRMSEIDSRWVSRILQIDQDRHPAPLSTPRRNDDRVAGCCRDFTLLAVAGLRQHGIAARSRIGFAGYFVEGWHHDHVVVEMLDGGRFVDAQLDPADWPFDTQNVPRGLDGFATAAEVWTAYRHDGLDLSTYGVGPDLPLRGEWFVGNYVLLELAHRQGDELLLWDGWGAKRGLGDDDRAEIALIDEIAALLVAADGGDAGAEAELADRYAGDERLHPGTRIVSHSPCSGDVLVDLEARTALPA